MLLRGKKEGRKVAALPFPGAVQICAGLNSVTLTNINCYIVFTGLK